MSDLKHRETNPDTESDAKSGDAIIPRIIQYQGKRFGIRLEDTFWSALESEAERRGIRLNALVHEVYTDPAGEANRTAHLRRHTVHYLERALEDATAQVQMGSSEVTCMLRMTARPALVFTDEMQVARTNDAFRRWLILRAKSDRDDLIAKLRIGFRASYRCLIDRLSEEGGMVSNEACAVLIPGLAVPVRMDVARVGDCGDGCGGFMGIILDR